MDTNDLGVQLHQNGNSWRATWYDSNGKRQRQCIGSKAKLTKRQALQKCYALATEHIVRPASLSKEKAPMLKAWTDHFIANRPELSDKTRELYRYTIALLIGEFGADEPIDSIDRFAARAWRTMLAKKKDEGGKGMAEATVCLHVRNAKTIFNMAVDDEIIVRNPFAKLKGTPPELDKAWPELSDADIQRIVDAAPAPAWKAMAGLLAWAGLRRGEALRLTWQDIQWERNRLIVRNASGKVTTKQRTREVLLVEPLAKLLLDVRETTTSDRPADVSSNNLRRTMRHIIRRAGFAEWSKTFHAFRKSRATTWRAKFPESVVDAWLGHSLAVARKHYTKVPEQFYGADELTKARAEIERLTALVQRTEQ